MKRIVSVAALLVALIWAGSSDAFRMIQQTGVGRFTAGPAVPCNDAGGFTHWGPTVRTINWFHNTANQGAGKAAALQAAMLSWTNVSSTDYTLVYAGTTNAGFATDGQNAVLWANGNGCTGSCLALTALVLQAGQVIVESDVTFNDTRTWTTNGADFDTQSVAVHEFGHSLGVHHTELSSSPLPSMRTPYFGIDGRTLESDDRAALQCSECRFCSHPRNTRLTGSGASLGGRKIGSLTWACTSCLFDSQVDIYRDGVLIVNNSANDGAQNDVFFSSATSANYWVCNSSSTGYNINSCSNVITVTF